MVALSHLSAKQDRLYNRLGFDFLTFRLRGKPMYFRIDLDNKKLYCDGFCIAVADKNDNPLLLALDDRVRQYDITDIIGQNVSHTNLCGRDAVDMAMTLLNCSFI